MLFLRFCSRGGLGTAFSFVYYPGVTPGIRALCLVSDLDLGLQLPPPPAHTTLFVTGTRSTGNIPLALALCRRMTTFSGLVYVGLT